MKINALKTLLRSTKRARQSKIEETPDKVRVSGSFFESGSMKISLWVLLAMMMAAMITPRLIVPGYKYQLDDIAVYTVNAPRDFSVEDQKATELKTRRAPEGGARGLRFQFTH